ncbi:MAG: hypothetical protein AAGL98_04950 [Planctomycetota bacterium]
MAKTISAFALLLGVTLGLAACAPPTYINIPPENGDWAFSNPNAKDVQQMEVAAVRKSLAADPIDGPYEIRLPERTRPETYAEVAHALGDDALVPGDIPAVAVDEDGKAIKTDGETQTVDSPVTLGAFPTVEVRSIRIRGARGQVDLVRPSASGRRLTTVYLEWEAGFGWFAERLRNWRVDPETQPQPLGPINPRPRSDS